MNTKVSSTETQVVALLSFSFSMFLLTLSPQCTSVSVEYLYIKIFRNGPQPPGRWNIINKHSCVVLCTPLPPPKPGDAQVRLKWRKVASYTTTNHKDRNHWNNHWTILAMCTAWHLILMESVKVLKERQSSSIVRLKKNLEDEIQWKSRAFKEYCNVDNSKGNSGNLNPNIQVLLSYNVTKTKCLGVWFLEDFPTHTVP